MSQEYAAKRFAEMNLDEMRSKSDGVTKSILGGRGVAAKKNEESKDVPQLPMKRKETRGRKPKPEQPLLSIAEVSIDMVDKWSALRVYKHLKFWRENGIDCKLPGAKTARAVEMKTVLLKYKNENKMQVADL